jgi:hypothetical protein
MALVARRFLPLLAVLAALFAAAPAQAAAPNYILVSGPGIRNPILLADWNENLELLGSLVDAPVAKGRAVRNLARRPRFDLAEFWGWGTRPRPTRASQANQHGWLYPAHASKPAVIVLMVNGTRIPRLLPARVREIFVRHHVPLRL